MRDWVLVVVLAAARELATRGYLMKAGGELGAAGPMPALLARADLAAYELVTDEEGYRARE